MLSVRRVRGTKAAHGDAPGTRGEEEDGRCFKAPRPCVASWGQRISFAIRRLAVKLVQKMRKDGKSDKLYTILI